MITGDLLRFGLMQGRTVGGSEDPPLLELMYDSLGFWIGRFGGLDG